MDENVTMDENVNFLLEDFIEKDKKDIFITAQFIIGKDGEKFSNINEIKEYMQLHRLIRIENIRWYPTDKARNISKEGGWLKHLDNEYKSKLEQQAKVDSKEQLEIEILKLQKENLEKSSKIRLNVFELINRQPILNYRISVVDRIIITIDNKDVTKKGASKVIDISAREKLDIFELSDKEKLDFSNQLTHKFKIKSFGKNYLFLNLTDNDLIKLGFIEPKINDNKSINKLRLTKTQIVSAIVFLAALTTFMLNLNGISKMFQSWRNDTNQNQSITPKEISQPTKSHHDKILSKSDSVNISKTGTLKTK